MIGKVTFTRGNVALEATMNERGIWVCPDPCLERSLNRLPNDRRGCELDEAVECEQLCCAADVFEGDVFLDL